MDDVSAIYTHGAFAYAVSGDKSKIAFFDGRNWQGAVAVEGIKVINDIIFAYAENASNANIWLISEHKH